MSCYKTLTDPVVVDGREIPLATIKKQKNDDMVEEGWVLCAGCNKWQHQICALFNHRRHDQSPSRNYYCPRCLLHELKTAHQRGYRIPQPRMKRAADLEQVCRPVCAYVSIPSALDVWLWQHGGVPSPSPAFAMSLCVWLNATCAGCDYRPRAHFAVVRAPWLWPRRRR